MIIPKVDGVLETSLYVDDLQKSISFYKNIFGLETLVSTDRFCALSVSDRQVLLLFEKGASVEASRGPGGVIPSHDGTGHLHFAFSIAKSDLENWKFWLQHNKVTIESEYHWERGGTSLYFRDSDNHLLELATPGLWSIY
ncbi:MAG TPA: VOC family protein [Pricia sp.]|nr:VOC family protein [Pricia sp.]